MNVMAPGTRLRVPELLKERGWKAMDLFREAVKRGHTLGLKTAYRLERGESKGIELSTLDILKYVFGVPLEELFSEDESG